MACVLLTHCLTFIPGCAGDSLDPTRQAERDRMVDEQLISRGIKDQAVLAAGEAMQTQRARERFFEEIRRLLAEEVARYPFDG